MLTFLRAFDSYIYFNKLQPITSASDNYAFYYETKTPINFLA